MAGKRVTVQPQMHEIGIDIHFGCVTFPVTKDASEIKLFERFQRSLAGACLITENNRNTMQAKWSSSEWRRASAFLMCLVLSLWMVNCDTFDTETSDDGNTVTAIQREVVVTPKNAGIFDLRSMWATKADRRLVITSPPTLGTLISMGNDVLRYVPNQGVFRGTDKIKISIYSPSSVIEKVDSIVVIIEPDSTHVPCNLSVRTQDDYVSFKGGQYLDVDVLENDTVCGVPRAQLVVTLPDNLILAGTPIPPSYYGTVEVLEDGRIRYTPGPNFTNADKFVYKVEKPIDVPSKGDYATVGYGFVYIAGGSASDSCKAKLALHDDLFEFKLDSIDPLDSLYLPTAANDTICEYALNNFLFSFKEVPQGKLFYGHNYGFTYLPPPNITKGFTDTFTYGVCVDQVCKEATVQLKFK